MKQVIIEKNRFKRAWIWFWYNDITRLFFLSGLPSLSFLIVSYFFFGEGDYLKDVAIITYIIFFFWMIIDNNYGNLRKIGLDEYRRRI